jgi:hypothetical protein
MVINAEFMFMLRVTQGNISDSCSAVKGGAGVEFSDGSPVMGRRPWDGNACGFNWWLGTEGAFAMRRGSCSTFERSFETLDEIETASFTWRSTLHSERYVLSCSCTYTKATSL